MAERKWGQFHTSANLAKSIAIEASELLECFQWTDDAAPQRAIEELADVLTHAHLLAARLGVDPDQIVQDTPGCGQARMFPGRLLSDSMASGCSGTQPLYWVNTPTSVDEVGSIHTIQGYHLNYAGVIIGRASVRRAMAASRSTGATTTTRGAPPTIGCWGSRTPTMTFCWSLSGSSVSASLDPRLLAVASFVRNIYALLLTRGVLGTYVYVCDPALREYLRKFM